MNFRAFQYEGLNFQAEDFEHKSLFDQIAAIKPVQFLHRLFKFCMAAVEIHDQRRTLRNLSDRMLNDIGLTRADVDQECGRRFFDIPRYM